MRRITTIKGAAEILGIRHGLLREWYAHGFLKPYIKAKGRGKPNVLDKYCIVEIILMQFLIDKMKISRSQASLFVNDSVNHYKIRSVVGRRKSKVNLRYRVSIFAEIKVDLWLLLRDKPEIMGKIDA